MAQEKLQQSVNAAECIPVAIPGTEPAAHAFNGWEPHIPDFYCETIWGTAARRISRNLSA
jgi:hypothetical protein